MNLKIAVPDNKIYSELYRNADEVGRKYALDIIKTGEKEVRELMLNNRVDVALLSPLGYGMGVIAADYRIIPGPALSVYGYTGMASVFFSENSEEVKIIASGRPDDFLLLIGLLLLAENYDMYPEVNKSNLSLKEMLDEFDSAIVWESSSGMDKALDITEEWFFMYDMPLPLAFWVCRAEEYPEKIGDIIRELASKDLLEEEEVWDNETAGFGERNGIIFWKWTKDIDKSLEQTLQLLYFHQMIPELAGIKMIGMDDKNSNTEKAIPG